MRKMKSMNRFRIDVSYDGTAYAGWQVQPNVTTVQHLLEKAIKKITSEKTKVHGSGRTDQGVHARKQVAHFDLKKAISSVSSFKNGLNAVLPADIRILKVMNVASDFHARRSVSAKEYRYFIWNSNVMPPFLRNYRVRVRKKLDVEAMRIAAGLIAGRHDFTAFSANPGREVENPVRALYDLRVIKRGKEIIIIAKAEGFLYKMVRSIVGFLIRVGDGSVPPAEANSLLSSGKRTAHVPTARPQGLFLWNVWY